MSSFVVVFTLIYSFFVAILFIVSSPLELRAEGIIPSRSKRYGKKHWTCMLLSVKASCQEEGEIECLLIYL